MTNIYCCVRHKTNKNIYKYLNGHESFKAITKFFFYKYLPENGRRRPKHGVGLRHVCILLYLIIVQFCNTVQVYVMTCLTARNTNDLKYSTMLTADPSGRAV